MKKIFFTALFLIPVFTTLPVKAQDKVIDEVVAVVGSHPVLYSDVEVQFMQMKAQTTVADAAAARCQIFEQLLFQKLLLYQAEVDSIVVDDEQVNATLDQKLRYYIQQFGSQEKLEDFYDKSILEIKEEFREPIREQMLSEQVQRKITESIKITPTEVKKFFEKIPADSIPVIPMKYEVAQIVKEPDVSAEELSASREKITALRNRILKGEKFSTLAVLYSEDPGSASKGGELGFFGRGDMAPEFEAAAFSLKNKEDMSEVIRTKFGFHIIQLIERRGELINARHILIIPKVSPLDLLKAKNELDSISGLIAKDSISFEKAALKFSDDPGKVNNGLLINQASNNSVFPADQLDPKIFFVIDKLDVGSVSAAVPYSTEDGTSAYRILKLVSRTQPHKATLKDDYDQIQEWALNEKKGKAVAKWIADKSKTAFIRIDDKYKNCTYQYNWNL